MAGAVLYRLVIAFAFELVPATDLKLISAVISLRRCQWLQ